MARRGVHEVSTWTRMMGARWWVLSCLSVASVACGQERGVAAQDSTGQDSAQTDAVGPQDASATVDVGAEDSGAGSAPPTVSAAETYSLKETKDIVYAQGLVDATWGATPGKAEDLKLNLWEPQGGDGSPRPALILIHGGGFTGGTPENAGIVAICKYLAKRGWVTASISYRLAKTQGPIPASWDKFAAATASAEQVRAMYLAARDGRAAVRWLAANAATYNVHPDHIAVGGGSAGAFTAIAVGVSEPGDYRDELTLEQDPTLASTHPNASSSVRAILDFWGGPTIPTIAGQLDSKPRFDVDDPPLAIVHGTADPTVDYSNALELVQAYKDVGAKYELFTLEGKGHGAWGAKHEGKPLTELSFDFLVKHQQLGVSAQ